MALISKNPCTLTIVVHTWIIVLIFCFAGCAAGSCLSYGHSCWGAHGKRSSILDAPVLRTLTAKGLSNGKSQDNVGSSSNVQWILSRLITGWLPSTDKYRTRWNSFPKSRTYVPPKWEHEATLTDDGNIEPLRNAIDKENGDNEKQTSNIQGITHSAKVENAPEILLVSSNDYDESVNDPQKLEVLKLLSKRNGNMK